MNNETNGAGNGRLPNQSDQPETLLTDEAEKLIRHVFETPIQTDEQLSQLGKIYTDYTLY